MAPRPGDAYMPQLDGLRALAVLAVLHFHFFPNLTGNFGLGHVGVNAFFVLSGFLITAILLRCRTLIEDRHQGPGVTVLRFYIRRFLRIFPAFYAALALTALLDLPPVRQTLGWHAAYLSNVYFAIHGRFDQAVSPWWSLAVEEQFYLLWPSVVLFCPRRALTPMILAMILAAPLWRWGLLLAGGSHVAAKVLTPGCMDTLAGGALLAVLWQRLGGDAPRIRSLALASTALGVVGLLLTHLLLDDLWSDAIPVLGTFFLAPTFFGVVHLAAGGIPGPVGSLLAFPPLAYVGKISYGIYVIHNFMPFITPRIPGLHANVWSGAQRLGWSSSLVEGLVFPLIWSGMSIAVAAASWHFFENPINRLKDRFPYRVLRPQAEAPPRMDEKASSERAA